MNTDTGQDKELDEVKALFRDYQGQREKASQQRQKTLLDKLNTAEGSSRVKATNDDEQVVFEQYKKYMSQREGNRSEVISNVSAYAQLKVKDVSVEDISEPDVIISVHPIHSIGWLSWLRRSLQPVTRLLEDILDSGIPHWQMALPGLAMVAVIFWLIQPVKYGTENVQTVVWNEPLPSGVMGHAQSILDSLRPNVPPTAGFTQKRGALAAGFELGQVMADVELAVSAQSEHQLSDIVKRADSLANHLGLLLLSAQADFKSASASLSDIAQQWFGGDSELSALYQMGHWMETMLFAMQLAESNDDMTPMEEQLALFSEYQEQWGEMLEKHPMQWQQFNRLLNLDTASLQSVSGRQTYVHQLERTMAVFKDL
jgi:hypothetical protein